MWSVSFNPIWSWPLLLAASLAILAANWWIYRKQRPWRGKRLIAVGLRFAAVLLCLLAASRPSLVIAEKKRQNTAILFLADSSASMSVADQAGGVTRWSAALEGVAQARNAVGGLGENVEAKYYKFDSQLEELPETSAPPTPQGQETALGSMLEEAVKLNEGKRIATLYLFSDGASNHGQPPLVAAELLKARGVRIVSVKLGSPAVGPDSRDIAVRDVVAGPSVFVKNELQVRGSVLVRGFRNQKLNVELLADGEVVGSSTIEAKETSEIIPIRDLKHTFTVPGEKRISLRIQPRDGELVKSNNEASAYVDVLKGGLSVLYVQGSNFTWEYKYLIRSLDSSPDIQADLVVLRRPATFQGSELPPDALTPGRFDVYILGDVPANVLTPDQHRRLAQLVERGAGLLMLGGRSSFAAGGWGSTPLAQVLPSDVARPGPNANIGDGDLDSSAGIKVQPIEGALDSYILRLGGNREESRKIWDSLPPIPGASPLGRPKDSAVILARSPDNRPLLLMRETGQGRAMAFAGETWVWSRFSEQTQSAHRKFWRQMILWLARKEDKGENQVKIALDRRIIRPGQKLEISAKALNSQNEPIPNVTYQTQLSKMGDAAPPESIELYSQGREAKGIYFAAGKPSERRVEVIASVDGKEIGRSSARFLVAQDDREMENPAANLDLLRQISQITGGESIELEELSKNIRTLNLDQDANYSVLTEHRLWDNWPFLLAFVVLLVTEWWTRRRIGWV